ncbi:hypothetical protein ACSVBT_07115 [Afipia sp. TerB]
MSTKQVVFDSGGASPLRISAAGVDASGAEFSDLLFDANQSPLRVLQTGAVAVTGPQFGNIAPAIIAPVALSKTFPSGKYPLFCCNTMEASYAGGSLPGWLASPWRQTPGAGSGGAVSENRFFGVNFNKQTVPNNVPLVTVYYMIFRNYN